MVDAHDEGGRHIILGWGGDDHLFCPALKVQRAQLLSVERACGLNNVLGSAVRPGDLPRVALAEHTDLVPIDDQILLVVLHRSMEGMEHRVIFDHIFHIVQIRFSQVDAPKLKFFSPLQHDPKRDAPDPTKPIDTNRNTHDTLTSILIFVLIAYFTTLLFS